MKSIYSLIVLQRIIDHWGTGRIKDVTYFDNAGRNIWRHYIETNQGVFELYSYPVSEKEYAEPKLKEYLENRHRKHLSLLQKKLIVHSFDRNHVLLQLSKQQQISAKQAIKDLDLLVGSTIEKAFRVYGTIFQMHIGEADVNKASVLVSYGSWSIQDYKKGRANVIADSRIHEYEKLDNTIKSIEDEKSVIERYALKGDWFELYLANAHSLHFNKSGKFPAIEVHLNSRKNDLIIFEENELYYTRDLRDE